MHSISKDTSQQTLIVILIVHAVTAEILETEALASSLVNPHTQWQSLTHVLLLVLLLNFLYMNCSNNYQSTSACNVHAVSSQMDYRIVGHRVHRKKWAFGKSSLSDMRRGRALGVNFVLVHFSQGTKLLLHGPAKQAQISSADMTRFCLSSSEYSFVFVLRAIMQPSASSVRK